MASGGFTPGPLPELCSWTPMGDFRLPYPLKVCPSYVNPGYAPEDYLQFIFVATTKNYPGTRIRSEFVSERVITVWNELSVSADFSTITRFKGSILNVDLSDYLVCY